MHHQLLLIQCSRRPVTESASRRRLRLLIPALNIYDAVCATPYVSYLGCSMSLHEHRSMFHKSNALCYRRCNILCAHSCDALGFHMLDALCFRLCDALCSVGATMYHDVWSCIMMCDRVSRVSWCMLIYHDISSNKGSREEEQQKCNRGAWKLL